MSELESKLVAFRKRVRLVLAWRHLALGATAGALAASILAVLDYFRILYSDWRLLVVIVGVGALSGAAVGWLRRVTDQALADSIDRRAKLQNRLATANEHPSTFGAEVEHDALAHLGGIRPKEVFPVRLTRWHGVAATLSLVTACLFILGNTPIFLGSQERADREELKEVAKTVERVARPILEQKPEQQTPESKELAKKFEQFSKDLEKGRMPKEEAMQKANELAKEAERTAKEQFEKSDANLGKAQEAIAKMAMDKALEDSGLSPEELEGLDPAEIQRGQEMGDEQRQTEMDDISKRLASLEKQLADGKGDNGEDLTKEQREALKQQADALKKQMKALQLSKKVRDFLKKLYAQPEFKELMEMMKKLQKINKDGKNGELPDPKISEEQIKEMLKKLEELADKLGNDDKAMKEFLEQLKKALEQSGGG